MNKHHILLIEDDEYYAKLTKYNLELKREYEVSLAKNAEDGLKMVKEHDFDLVCLDYSLPTLNGKIALARIKEQYHELPVIILSGQSEIEVVVDLLKEGANDYIIKNKHTKERLWNSAKNCIEGYQLKKEVKYLKQQLNKTTNGDQIIGDSKQIKKSLKLIDKASKSDINVSIQGETGTGKELVAKTIHQKSKRKNKPFIAINMSAIPKELLESELFGHEKGAFTGADTSKIGKIEQANGGTLFLDEIAEADLITQAKLLRVLQEREITKVGGLKPIKLDVRIITATHKNLTSEIENGKFREDFYYRILGLAIVLPPLRKRGNDIISFAEYFIFNYAQKNKKEIKSLTKTAKNKLLSYSFPGNVRELKSLVELAFVLSDGSHIEADDLQIPNLNNSKIKSGSKSLKDYKLEIIKSHLEEFKYDIDMVAKSLDIGKSTVYKIMKEENLK